VILSSMALVEMIFTDTPPYSRARLKAALGKAVLGAAVAIGVLGAGEAQAFLVVNVNGQDWNVTFFDGTQGGSNAALFQTPAQGGAMPWFTDNAASCGTNINASASSCLAAQFARAVGTSLNGALPLRLRFAFSGMTSNSVGLGEAGTACTGSSCLRTGQFIAINTTGTPISVGDPELDTEPQNISARWAYVDPVYPVPGPLPALGAAAAFGFSRKLRQRIKVNKSVGASITAG
jgi:hypothetical protein